MNKVKIMVGVKKEIKKAFCRKPWKAALFLGYANYLSNQYS